VRDARRRTLQRRPIDLLHSHAGRGDLPSERAGRVATEENALDVRGTRSDERERRVDPGRDVWAARVASPGVKFYTRTGVG